MYPPISLLALLALSSGILADNWSYHNFENWGGVCSSGKSQSPIDIDEDDALEDSVEPLLFLHYEDPINGFSMVNNGHTITLNLAHPCKLAVVGGELRGFYILDHVHLHWGSEHTVDHKRFAAEVHLVHFNRIYGNISEAKNHPRGIAVVGIFLEEDDKTNEALEPVLMEAKNAIEHKKIKVPISSYTLKPLIPDNTDEFYRYDGSLTTPPCSESVIWTLMKNTVSISKNQVPKLKHIHLSHGTTNYRPVQPMNGRQVLLLSSKFPVMKESSGTTAKVCTLLYSLVFFRLFLY